MSQLIFRYALLSVLQNFSFFVLSVVRAIKMQLGSLHNCKLNDGNSAFGQAENILIFGKSAVESSGERRVESGERAGSV